MNAAAPLQVETYPPVVALGRLSPSMRTQSTVFRLPVGERIGFGRARN